MEFACERLLAAYVMGTWGTAVWTLFLATIDLVYS